MKADCPSCGAENLMKPSCLGLEPQCGVCRAPLDYGAVGKVARLVWPMRFSLLIGVGLTGLLLLHDPSTSTPNGPESAQGGDLLAEAAHDPFAVAPSPAPASAGSANRDVIASRADDVIMNAAIPNVGAEANSARKAVPLPAHGVLRVYAADERIAPLRITTPDGSSDYFVKLVRTGTSQTVITFFVRRGRTLETEVPLGSMQIRYATGEHWQGEETLFGPETIFIQADHVFDFERLENGVSGYTVELIKRRDGNLHTRTINRSEF